MKWNQNKRSLTLLFEIVAFVVVISLGFAVCDTSTTPANYTVTFDTGGGGAIAPVTVDAGSTVNKPANPTRTGYSFDNWYTAATGGSVISWPLTVSGDITLYARWIAMTGSISITFSGPQDETRDLEGTSETLSWTTGTLNLSVPSANFPGATYQWYLGSAALSGATSSSLSKPGSDFTLGRREVTIRILMPNNRGYSKTLRFTVEP